jgi:hypothetical protein
MRLVERGEIATTPTVVSVARLYPEAKTCRDRFAQEVEIIAANLMRCEPRVARARLDRFVRERVQTELIATVRQDELGQGTWGGMSRRLDRLSVLGCLAFVGRYGFHRLRVETRWRFGRFMKRDVFV